MVNPVPPFYPAPPVLTLGNGVQLIHCWLKQRDWCREDFPHGKLKKKPSVCTPLARQSGLSAPTQAQPPVGVPGQEILVADSTDHSSAEQTDTTLSQERRCRVSGNSPLRLQLERRAGKRALKAHTLVKSQFSPPHPDPICMLFFISFLSVFQLLSGSSWPCLICPSCQAEGWEGWKQEVFSDWAQIWALAASCLFLVWFWDRLAKWWGCCSSAFLGSASKYFL